MVCCVTGHCPKGFLFLSYLCYLSDEIKQLIREGYEDFITGMAEGAYIDFADIVLKFRKRGEYFA